MSDIIAKVPEKFRSANVNDRGTLFLPAGRMIYANFFVPSSPDREDKSQGKLQWGLTLLIPAGFDLSEVDRMVDEIITKEHKPANAALRAKIKRPVIETAGVESLAGYADEYPFSIRLAAKAFDKNGQPRQRPGVIDARNQPITEDRAPEECYDGRWCRISARPYPWTHPTGGKGVSLGLGNAQLLWNDDPLARGAARASDEFEAVEIEDFGDFT